jgi:hypothetical protein
MRTPSAVEGADHQVLGRARAHQRLGALAHLLRGLVGEGDGGDLLRRQAACSSRAILCTMTRVLPEPGAGQHQAGAGQVVHRLQLGGVESQGRADLWNLRSHLFGAISLAHGEHVARERLQQLDAHWD